MPDKYRLNRSVLETAKLTGKTNDRQSLGSRIVAIGDLPENLERDLEELQ